MSYAPLAFRQTARSAARHVGTPCQDVAALVLPYQRFGPLPVSPFPASDLKAAQQLRPPATSVLRRRPGLPSDI
jgi:hypothetical protein